MAAGAESPSEFGRQRHASDSSRSSDTVDHRMQLATVREEGRCRRVSEGDERDRHDSGNDDEPCTEPAAGLLGGGHASVLYSNFSVANNSVFPPSPLPSLSLFNFRH